MSVMGVGKRKSGNVDVKSREPGMKSPWDPGHQSSPWVLQLFSSYNEHVSSCDKDPGKHEVFPAWPWK